jgi:hypothetical protein
MALLVEALGSPTAAQAGSVAPTSLYNMSMCIVKGLPWEPHTASERVPTRVRPAARILLSVFRLIKGGLLWVELHV